MEVRRLGRSALSLSRIGLGTAGFAAIEARDPRRLDALVGEYLTAGGFVFDTADSYDAGACEETLGRQLKGRRDRAVVMSKVGWPVGGGAGGLGGAHVRRSIDESLRRLGTDHLDVYQLHFYDDGVPIEETLEALQAAVTAGKVLHVGASSFFAWQLARTNAVAEAAELPRIQSVQLAYNLLQRDAEREHLGYCATEGVSVVVYSPLHGGVLADGWTSGSAGRLADPLLREVYLGEGVSRTRDVTDAITQTASALGRPISEVGLAWLFAQDDVSCVLVGPSTVAELASDLRALGQPLPPEALAQLTSRTAPAAGYPASFYDRKHRMWARLSSTDGRWSDSLDSPTA